MKHLLTLTALLISSLAMGQFPNLPYNPDENGDGLIGVVDLQGLLANYGNEFASAVVSEDGESAIVYMGDMGYYECKHSCNQLPGFWSLPSGEDLVPVFSDLNTNYTNTWLSVTDFKEVIPYARVPYYRGATSNTNRNIGGESYVGSNYRCYCAAKQLPRVEYDYCRVDDMTNDGAYSQLKTCINSKLQDGWQLFGSSRDGEDFSVLIQAFWRWAE